MPVVIKVNSKRHNACRTAMFVDCDVRRSQDEHCRPRRGVCAGPTGFILQGFHALGLPVREYDAVVMWEPRTTWRVVEFPQVPMDVKLVTALHEDPSSVLAHQLASGDDPGNAWVFGKDDELFRHDLAGQVPTPSGYVALVSNSPAPGSATEEIDTWEDMADAISSSPRREDGGRCLSGLTSQKWPTVDGRALTCVFAGPVLFSGGVEVYALRKAKEDACTGMKVFASETL